MRVVRPSPSTRTGSSGTWFEDTARFLTADEIDPVANLVKVEVSSMLVRWRIRGACLCQVLGEKYSFDPIVDYATTRFLEPSLEVEGNRCA